MSQLIRIGTLLLGVGLILLGLASLFATEFAAEGYGLAVNDSKGLGFVMATGVRDIALGLLSLVLAMRHPRVVPALLACMLIIPIADLAIVLKLGSPLPGSIPHALGMLYILALFLLATRFHRSSSPANPAERSRSPK